MNTNRHDPNNRREEDELAEFAALLKQSLPPTGNESPRRDLWPAMLRRLDARPARIPWWDWALLTAALIALAFYPNAIPALLYHL
jgi:hypothetical protein